MAEEISPTVARRELRLVLREAREQAGLTQSEVAEKMEWSLSKVIRIEAGDVTIAPNDLRPLLSYLNIKDKTRVTELLAIAKIARTRQRTAWYRTPGFRPYFTDAMLQLIEYEAVAVEIRHFSLLFIPGPLQTLEYAQANLGTYDDDDVNELQRKYRAEARRLRNATVIERRDKLKLFALLDESVFRRPIGGPHVFAGQLRHLVAVARSGQLRIRMIPFTFGAAITNNATFDLITLPGGGEALYRELGVRDEIVEDVSVTQRHHKRFDKIWHEAESEEDTINFMLTRIAELDAQIERGGFR